MSASMTNRTRLVTVALAAAAWIATPAAAGTIGLQWGAASGANGYRVYWGPSPGNYTNWTDVGNVTEAVLTNVEDCSDSYYAVTAYNSAGESGFSNEVQTWPYAEVARVTPDAVRQGTQFTLRFEGANFDPADDWRIDFEPDPCVGLTDAECPFHHDPAQISVTCNRVEVLQTAEPLVDGSRPAQTGEFTAWLRNGSDEFGEAFVVDVDPVRMNVDRSSSPLASARIDGGDLAGLGRRWLGCDPVRFDASACGGPEAATFDFAFDFSGDGQIDGEDLALLATVFGMCWNGNEFTAAACPR